MTGKIAVVTGPYEVDIRSYPVPEPLEDGLVIQVEAAAVCGSDKHNLETAPKQPRTIGHEFVGTIVAMGKKAGEGIDCLNGTLALGDRIVVYPHITCGHCLICREFGPGVCICDNDWMYGGGKFHTENVLNNDPDIWPHFKGGFSEYVYIFPKTSVWKVPDDMPGTIAVLLDPLAVAMRAVEQALALSTLFGGGTALAKRCLVIGAGPIGIMCGMILRALGVEKLVFTDLLDVKLKKAMEIAHADAVLNTSLMSMAEKTASMDELTCGGPNIVIACANSASATLDGLNMIQKLGAYVEVGAVNAEQSNLTNKLVFKKNICLTSVQANTAQCFDRSMRFLLRHHTLPFEKLVTHEFHSLEDLVPTARHMSDADYLKGVLTFGR